MKINYVRYLESGDMMD